MTPTDKDYFKEQKNYWNSKRNPKKDYTPLYNEYYNRSSNNNLSSDPNLQAWEEAMSKDPDYLKWLDNRRAINKDNPTEGPKNLYDSILDDRPSTANFSDKPLRKTIPGTGVNNSFDIVDLIKKAKQGKASQEDLVKLGQAENEQPGILAENGAGPVTIEAAKDAFNGIDVPPAEVPEPQKNSNEGIDDMYNKFKEINAKKAGYNDLPVSFKDFQDNLQYESIYTDWLKYKDAKNLENEAHEKDPVRGEAKTYAEQLKEIADKGNRIINQKAQLEKDLKNANSKMDKRIIQNTIKQYEGALSDLEKKWEDLTSVPMSKIDDDDYLISIGVDPERIDELAKDAGIDLSGFMGNVKDTQEKISYLKNNIKDDMDTLMNVELPIEERQAAADRVDQVLPELRKHVDNDIELSKGTLDSLIKVAENIGDEDIIEMAYNIEGMTHLFEEQNKMMLNPENMDKILGTVKDLEDIVKHQDNYNADSRYARDARLSAFNKLLFDVFDRVKTDIVFLAAIESGNPSVIRSALEEFNYKLEAAENKRQTDKFGAYTDNRLREITQDNLAKFKEITEVEPALKQLEGEINLDSRRGRIQMQSLINAWEEYQKQVSSLPADQQVSFASWVMQNSGSGNAIISALLNNFPQLMNQIDNISDSISLPSSSKDDPPSSKELKENVENVSSESKEKKTSEWLDSATSKLSKQKEKEKEKEDPDLMIDVQNTVNQALASKGAPPQAGAPQTGAPQTSSGFGRTNLS